MSAEQMVKKFQRFRILEKNNNYQKIQSPENSILMNFFLLQYIITI